MAERVGFEPTVPVRAQQFSRLPDSTTLAPLRHEFTIIMRRKGRIQVRQLFIVLYEKKPALIHDTHLLGRRIGFPYDD